MASRRSRVGARRDRLAVVLLGLVFLTGILPTGSAVAVEPSGSTEPAAIEPSTEPSTPPSPEPSPAEDPSAPAPSEQPSVAPTPNPTSTPQPTATASPSPTDPGPPDVEEPGPVPSGRPVTEVDPARHPELVDERTATSRTFDLGDGQRVTELSSEARFYQPEPGAAFEPIELAFAEADDDALVIERSPVTVRVADAADPAGFLVLDDRSGFVVGLHPTRAPPAADPPVVLDDAPNAADVRGAVDGLDVRIAARADGANVFLVVRERPATPSWTLGLSLPEDATIAPDPEVAGALVIRDAVGTVRARIAAPYAVDSTPDALTGSGRMTNGLHYELADLGGGRQGLTVVLDDVAWLDEAVYPVYVDPSTTIVSAGTSTYGDTFLNEGNAGQNYANYQRPDAPTYYELWLGESPSDASYKNHALLRFDLAAIAGQAVDAAELRLRPYHAYYDAPTTRTVWARRVTESWGEGTATWTNRPAKTTTSIQTDCAESASLSCALDATYWTRQWSANVISHWGFWVDTDGNGATYWKRLIASEQGGSTSPRLYVEYHSPVSAASPLALTPTSSRTLSWAYDEPNAGAPQATYRVEVSTSAGFSPTLVTSGDVTSAATGWEIPSGTALTAGTTYHWRVRVTIGSDPTPSPWATGSFVWAPDANLGVQAQHTVEDWDLGGGDTLSVNVATGNLLLSHPIADLPIRGGSLPITLAYNSHDPTDVGVGPGFRLDLQRRLAINGSVVTFTDAGGARHVFTASGTIGTVTSYGIPDTIDARLVRDSGLAPYEFSLTYKDRSVDVFETVGSVGRLKYVRDRFGTANQVTLTYTGTTMKIDTIVDPASRTIQFTWNADATPHVTAIRDWAVIASGEIAATGTPDRTTRFFYASGILQGWAEPPNTTSTSCASPAAYLTCLTHASGRLATIAKTHTTAAIAGSAITTATPVVATTTITYRGAEVAAVRDATQSSTTETTIARSAPGEVTVTRVGTPNLVRRYALVTAPDPYARISTVTRAPGTGQVVTKTTWDTTHPTKVASVIEDFGGGLARTVSNTWTGGGTAIGPNLTVTTEPLTGSENRITTTTYNGNDDVTRTVVASSTSGGSSTTDYSYTAATGCAGGLLLCAVIDNPIDGTPGGSDGHLEDIRTDYQYDPTTKLRTREQRHVYRQGSTTPLDERITAFEYDTAGNLTKEIANYANGLVSSPGADVDPDTTTNARTDLTTVHGYDSAGNRTSTTDPRRAIEAAKGTTLVTDDFVTRWAFDALDREVREVSPKTPGVTITQKTAATVHDELGGVRSHTDFGDRQTATKADKVGRPLETYEDTDGSLSGASVVVTGAITRDAAGRELTSRDQRQAAAPSTYGETTTAYDAHGRAITVIEAYKAPPSSLPDESTTVTTYDALDRVTCVQVGWMSGACATASGAGQSTVTGYDQGGRATSVDDEFTCTTTQYDWRDLATQITEGRVSGSPCTGTGSRTIVQSFDALGRMTSRAVSGGDVLEASVLDGAGRALKTHSTEPGNVTRAVETEYNALDEPTKEYRYTDVAGTKSAQTWARANRDGAGNETDRCTWAVDPGATWCVRADQTGSLSPAVTSAASSAFDARNNRIAQFTPGAGTTTYDPAADYQVAGIYLPTASGKERQTIHEYDGRHRLTKTTEVLCSTNQRPCAGGNILSTRQVSAYGYDGNDSRILATDDNGSGQIARHYCYDARDQLLTVRSASGCASGLLETYAYDPAGNRTTAPGRTYTYAANGTLATCSGSPACSPTFDADGRLTKITTLATGTWTYLYDAESRLVSACQAASCTGSGFARLDLVYDGEGHRTRLIETPSSGPATTTDFTYQGDTVVREVSTTPGVSTITRTFNTDESGAIVKVDISGDPATLHNGTYLVTWNGHGDALALSKVDPGTGTLTAANRYSYSTWGTPSATTHNGYGDLKFRYLYVGQFGVTWDSSASIPSGLHYMRARHYSPEFGRFLQPDPAAAEVNLFAYAANSPITNVDPTGECWWCRLPDLGRRLAELAQRIGVSVNNLLRGSPYVGNKLDYLLGLAKGSQHAIDRSRSMGLLLKSIGIVNNEKGRAILRSALERSWWSKSNVVSRTYGYRGIQRVVKESVLWGPNGAVKMVTVWDEYGMGKRLVTVYLHSKRLE